MGDEGRAVATALAGRDRAPLNDLGLNARDLANMAFGFGSGNATVKSEAGTDEIEAVVAAETDAGAVRHGPPPRGNHCRDGAKPLKLHRVHRVVFVGTGEVTVQRVD